MGWSRQKLEELLVGILVDMSAVQGNAKVTVLKDLTGEVRALSLLNSYCLVAPDCHCNTEHYCDSVP